MQVLEDDQRLLPRVASGIRFAGGLVGVAEAGERVGFFEAITEVAVQIEGVPVAVNGLGIAAEMVMGVAEAVPCGGLTARVADVLLEAEGFLAVREGLLMVPEQGVRPADRVECAGLPGLVAGGTVLAQGLLGMAECLALLTRLLECLRQAEVGVSLAGSIAEVSIQLEGALVVRPGAIEGAEPDAGTAEVAVRPSLAVPVI